MSTEKTNDEAKEHMTSTFPQQILNVPPELAAQGWRRVPDQSVMDAWRESGSNHRFDVFVPLPGDAFQCTIARPGVYTIKHDIWPSLNYAHEGWGEGLSPTPEMVKVWRWWWMRGIDGLQPVYVYVCDGEIVVDGLSSKYIDPTEWRGPVLPFGGTTI